MPNMNSHFNFPVRVYYEDTDAGGVVYYANYLKFLERARTEFLRHLGFEQTDLIQQHQQIIMVRNINVDYHKPALFNDMLTTLTTVKKMGKVSLQMEQHVLRENTLLCAAQVKLAGVHATELRPQQFPLILLQALQDYVS
ncbi:tol-pal system-associated acyl-CoA thioesterase [Candidatus Albibeggiatoa sp. nov. BB20]|uniref:tol-pal system-associated acyl-CoA thioesterase n=1 Tax=Candidatus Albibeggiatoa sp. nov. BB20 TaxID=3162723 RepID=UPI003365A1E4